MQQPSAADFVGLLLGSATRLTNYRGGGAPANVAAFGRYKVRPTLRKQPDVVALWLPLGRDGRKVRRPMRVEPPAPAAATVSRQVRRYLTREFDKDRAPMANSMVKILKQRQIAERNEARLAERQPEPALEHYA